MRFCLRYSRGRAPPGHATCDHKVGFSSAWSEYKVPLEVFPLYFKKVLTSATTREFATKIHVQRGLQAQVGGAYTRGRYSNDIRECAEVV